MSGLEAWVVVFGFAMVWGLESIRRTLKDCLKALEKIAAK
jgi:hypothetical protein